MDIKEKNNFIFSKNPIFLQILMKVVWILLSARTKLIPISSEALIPSIISWPGFVFSFFAIFFWYDERIRFAIKRVTFFSFIISIIFVFFQASGFFKFLYLWSSSSIHIESGFSSFIVSLTKLTLSCETWAVGIKIISFPW